jgi:Flp pilus assembly pilin Flp
MDRFNATLTRWFLALRDREEGQAAVEYGVLLALILVVSIAIIATIGTRLGISFGKIRDLLPAS